MGVVNYMSKIESEKGGACHILPESYYLAFLAVNKKTKASSITRINPPAINGDITAEYTNCTTFYLNFGHGKLLSALWMAELPSGVLLYCNKKPEADRATGLDVFPKGKKSGKVSAERSVATPTKVHCKYQTF